jgi:transposase-like protein
MQRKNHNDEFKAKAILKALRGEMTTNEIAQHF